MTVLAALRELLERNHVTFAEISRIEGARGDREITIETDEASNIVLWQGVSQELADALEIIRQEGQYEPRPTGILTYAIDGMMLRMPIAKRKRHYKTPHWLPVCFVRK
jgi:hypothetical protein